MSSDEDFFACVNTSEWRGTLERVVWQSAVTDHFFALDLAGEAFADVRFDHTFQGAAPVSQR